MIAELVFGGVALVATSAGWLAAYRARGETLACRDLLDAKDELADQYQHERDVEVAAHAVTSAQLKEATQRVSVVEAQRNELMRREAERLKESDVQTVASVLTDALSRDDWKSVHGVPSVSEAGHSSAGSDDLETP